MIDFNQLRREFETRITQARFRIPMQYENVVEEIDVKRAKRRNNIWGRVVIVEGSGITRSIGKTINRRFVGMVIVSLFFPQGKGTHDLRAKANEIVNYMTSLTLANIYIRTPEFAMVGTVEDWYQGNITIPFECDFIT